MTVGHGRSFSRCQIFFFKRVFWCLASQVWKWNLIACLPQKAQKTCVFQNPEPSLQFFFSSLSGNFELSYWQPHPVLIEKHLEPAAKRRNNVITTLVRPNNLANESRMMESQHSRGNAGLIRNILAHHVGMNANYSRFTPSSVANL